MDDAVMRFAIFDTETTGLTLPMRAPLEKQPHIIEVGVVLCDHNGVVLEEINRLVNPGCAVSERITEITGITNEMLAGQPSFADVLPALVAVFKQADVAIAHNASFDKTMFDLEMKRLGQEFPWPSEILCTVQEYTPADGKRPKLVDLYAAKLGKPLAQTHRALDDVMALHEVLVADSFFQRVMS